MQAERQVGEMNIVCALIIVVLLIVIISQNVAINVLKMRIRVQPADKELEEEKARYKNLLAGLEELEASKNVLVKYANCLSEGIDERQENDEIRKLCELLYAIADYRRSMRGVKGDRKNERIKMSNVQKTDGRKDQI